MRDKHEQFSKYSNEDEAKGGNPVRLIAIGEFARRNAIEFRIGCVRAVSASPLGARAVQSMENKRPGIFDKSGASAQVFSLYKMASAACVMLGPVWTSYAYDAQSWTFLVSSLGIFCASVAMPLVYLTEICSSKF